MDARQALCAMHWELLAESDTTVLAAVTELTCKLTDVTDSPCCKLRALVASACYAHHCMQFSSKMYVGGVSKSACLQQHVK